MVSFTHHNQWDLQKTEKRHTAFTIISATHVLEHNPFDMTFCSIKQSWPLKCATLCIYVTSPLKRNTLRKSFNW